MKNKEFAIIVMLLLLFQSLYSQTKPDTTKKMSVTLDEVVISANKIEERKRNVAQQMEVIIAKDITNTQAQSTADLISRSGIQVQKSQLGGGSPTLRGFEASRILLVIDGVRMNNLIYRAGHIQDIGKTDSYALERVEILFGPSSTMYGSDALGGVIHLFTKKPLLAAEDQKTNFKINLLSRYSSVDKELKEHIDFNYGKKRIAFLTSFTYSKYGDLMGGKKQNPFYSESYGERPNYVERIKNKDSLVKNSNRFLQVGSGYSQYDVIEKVLFQQNDHISHGLNLQYSNSTDVPRYDRLTDTLGTGLKYAEWYYGPQSRVLTAYDMIIKKSVGMFQNIHFGLNYQAIEESRHNRNFDSKYRYNRIENVNLIGANLNFQKITDKHNIRFGANMQLNSLKSTANKEDIEAGTFGVLDTRYPDGKNKMNDFAVFLSHTLRINEQLILTDGIRVGYSSLHSTLVDTALLFHLPFKTLEQKTPVYSGSIGLINSPTDDLKLSIIISTGFRVPNVDDLVKIFGPPSGGVIVPNVDLKPEKTINYEFGITKIFKSKSRWENAIYFTDYRDIAVIDSFIYNGVNSIVYEGDTCQVYANQNKDKAYLYGFSSNLLSKFNEHFMMNMGISYTYGRVKTDSTDIPLDHIPPFLANLALTYSHKRFNSNLSLYYNSAKKLKDFSSSGEDNEQYATAMGMPAWFTVNFRLSYNFHNYIMLQAGVDNIFDTQYRTFASGINAPGRNIFIALHFNY